MKTDKNAVSFTVEPETFLYEGMGQDERKHAFEAIVRSVYNNYTKADEFPISIEEVLGIRLTFGSDFVKLFDPEFSLPANFVPCNLQIGKLPNIGVLVYVDSEIPPDVAYVTRFDNEYGEMIIGVLKMGESLPLSKVEYIQTTPEIFTVTETLPWNEQDFDEDLVAEGWAGDWTVQVGYMNDSPSMTIAGPNATYLIKLDDEINVALTSVVQLLAGTLDSENPFVVLGTLDKHSSCHLILRMDDSDDLPVFEIEVGMSLIMIPVEDPFRFNQAMVRAMQNAVQALEDSDDDEFKADEA